MPRIQTIGGTRWVSMEEFERLEARREAYAEEGGSRRGNAQWWHQTLMRVRAAWVRGRPGRTKEEQFDALVEEFGFRVTVMALKAVVPRAKQLFEKYRHKWER